METLVTGLVDLFLLGASIWFSVRAKPLASKPYRWGTFIGIQCVAGFGPWFYLNYSRFPDLRILGVVMGCCGAASAVGILRRRRFGVVMFVVTLVLIVIFDLLSDAMKRPSELFAPLIFGVVSIVYFKRRWNLLAGRVQTAGRSLPIGDGDTSA